MRKTAAITVLIALGGTLSALVVTQATAAAKTRPGDQIFKQQCASCHGPKGEGSSSYKKPLTGDQSIGELSRYIAKAMPPGAKKKLSSAESASVAAFISDAFYSPVAQARNTPARIELSRLTVRQYRYAVADLIGTFRPAPQLDERRGLRGEYYRGSNRRRDTQVLERVDPEIRFDYGDKVAVAGQDDPYQFTMRWEGSVIAPESGEYEFVVRTDHAAQLWVNDVRKPIIDAAVKSGSDNEYRASLMLLGGRAYPVRLEFAKGVTGVNNLAELKKKPVQPAFLRLEWRRPHRTDEVIPQRFLSPMMLPETYVVTTAFPPDDRSIGYERGTSVSKAWDEATSDGAFDTAAYVAARVRDLSGVRDDDPDRLNKLKTFCRRFVTRAFRRPLTDELYQTHVEKQFAQSPDAELAIKRVVILALKSPRFLFREADGKDDAYDLASRLSFGAWDTLPDDILLKAAETGQLSNRELVRQQAERLLRDPKARAKVMEFFLLWLKVDQFPEVIKDPKQFPGFDAMAATDLRTSLELFLDQTIWSEKSDFRALFQGDQVPLNGRLAKLYGVNLPEDASFQNVMLDEGQRAGILTHPYLMSTFAYLQTSSPIHRGVLLSRNMLGRMLSPPPIAVTPTPVDLQPNLTTRQRVMIQTKPEACAKCHGLINNLGFALENFDAIGRYRTKENDKPVDASWSYESRTGKAAKASGAKELANYLLGSEETQAAFVEKLFQFMAKQPVRAYGPNALPELQRGFVKNEFSIRKQIVESLVVSATQKSLSE